MAEVTSQHGAVLVFLSLSMLGFICAMCLRCKKKRRIVQNNDQLYATQIFQRDGSGFAMMRTKTVTKTNQMSTKKSHSLGDFPSNTQSDEIHSYQNISKTLLGTMEPTYVDPIATPPNKSSVMDSGEYANVFPTQKIDHDSDASDYENTEFLQNHTEDDEPDYVNEGGIVVM